MGFNKNIKESNKNYDRYLKYSNAVYRICEKYGLNYSEIRKLIQDMKI